MNTQNEPDRMIMVVYGGSRRDSFRYRGHERLPLQCRPLIPTEQPLVVASISSSRFGSWFRFQFLFGNILWRTTHTSDEI
jgi:hypothetical protein